MDSGKQGLQKTAGSVHLWALGVGGVISGNYFGWQTGLLTGGFGGLLIAPLLIAVMYVCLVFLIAELSAALPDAGGFYNFTRAAFGKDRAFLNGLTDAIEYVTTPAVIVTGIAGYMKALVPGSSDWWSFTCSLSVSTSRAPPLPSAFPWRLPCLLRPSCCSFTRERS